MLGMYLCGLWEVAISQHYCILIQICQVYLKKRMCLIYTMVRSANKHFWWVVKILLLKIYVFLYYWGAFELFITLFPKFYNEIYLFVGSTTLRNLNEFWLVVSLIWVSKRLNHKLLSPEELHCSVSIGDVQQFIGHCLPLILNPFLVP